MAIDSSSCCQPCGVPTNPVNIPGIEGPAGAGGTNGTNGVNAFSLTNGALTIAAGVGANTITMLNATWTAVGQNIFVSDGVNVATFKITAVVSPTVVNATYLGYTGDSTVGTTIGAGAAVVAAGTEPPANTLEPTLSSYSLAIAQPLSAAFVQAGPGSITLPTINSHYLLFARGRFDYVNATYAANPTIITMKLSVSGGADVTNAIANIQTRLVTLNNSTATDTTLCPVDWQATAAGQVIIGNVMIAALADNDPAGTVNLQEFQLFGLPLF